MAPPTRCPQLGVCIVLAIGIFIPLGSKMLWDRYNFLCKRAVGPVEMLGEDPGFGVLPVGTSGRKAAPWR